MPRVATELGFLPGGDLEMPPKGKGYLSGELVFDPLLHMGNEPTSGLVELGNIDPYPYSSYTIGPDKRPTEKPFVYEEKGAYTVLPAMIDGTPQTREEAIKNYQGQGENFGRFKTNEDASAYADRIKKWASYPVPKKYAEEAVAKMPPPSKLPLEMIERGNIDIDKAKAENPQLLVWSDAPRPYLGHSVILPGSMGGVQMTPDEALRRFQATGEHLGMFSSPFGAETFRMKLEEREKMLQLKPEPYVPDIVRPPQEEGGWAGGLPEYRQQQPNLGSPGEAPEGFTVSNSQGQILIKRGGKWVPQ